MTSLKICVSPVMEKLEISNLDSRQLNLVQLASIGYSSSVGSDAITSQLCHLDKSLYLQLQRGYFYQICDLCLDRSPQGTPPLGVVMSLPLDHVILINLYISSYIDATEAMFINAHASVFINFLFQTFCENRIQQILQERQMFPWQLTCLQVLVFEHKTS